MAKRVYFAFHYQDVIDFRANVVRKHNFAEGVESAGYYDHSIWEEAKKTSPEALKKLIDTELEGTSVTVVLIGSDTWQRRWVRYEIFQSVWRSNSILGIHINSIKGKDKLTKPLGINPFEYMGLEFDPNGQTARPYEWTNGGWHYNPDKGIYNLATQPHPLKGQDVKLSRWYPAYDWVTDNGYDNFSSWIGS
jgi:hypothetical protein